MKARLLFLSQIAFRLIVHDLGADQAEADRKLVAEFRAKAEKGEAKFQCKLAESLFWGNWGVAKDETEAIKWWRKAAEQNYASAQFCLGVCYAYGKGMRKDEVEAVKLYRKAAEQNDPAAQTNLGVCYKTGCGVVKDEAEAVKWYRRAANRNYSAAQFNLGLCYATGEGVGKDETEAVKWYLMAAEQGDDGAQSNLGVCFQVGRGVAQDPVEAIKWFRKAADQGYATAQANLGFCYAKGDGVLKDLGEATRWWRRAAEQNDPLAQTNLGICYTRGDGVSKDYVAAYKWSLLAGAQDNENARKSIRILESLMTREQTAEGQKLAREFSPRQAPSGGGDASRLGISQSRPESTGTGFFITVEGYFITNQHVADEGATVRLVTAAGLISAKVVKVDKANDLALLKAEGKFTALPVITSRGVRLGATAATVGFPNTSLQGFAPKLARGEIASLAGAQDDARHFQISAPIQPGNSGGALVDERGNVIGVVVAKLSQRAALATTGTLAENVNYAVKSSYLLSFLESVPEVAAKLKEPNTKPRKFEDVVKDVEQATVLVLVY